MDRNFWTQLCWWNAPQMVWSSLFIQHFALFLISKLRHQIKQVSFPLQNRWVLDLREIAQILRRFRFVVWFHNSPENNLSKWEFLVSAGADLSGHLAALFPECPDTFCSYPGLEKPPALLDSFVRSRSAALWPHWVGDLTAFVCSPSLPSTSHHTFAWYAGVRGGGSIALILLWHPPSASGGSDVTRSSGWGSVPAGGSPKWTFVLLVLLYFSFQSFLWCKQITKKLSCFC